MQLEAAVKKARELREYLHTIPEPSGYETKTKAALINFLKENTSCEINDRGAWFYAIHREQNAGQNIAFRADFDAILAQEGGGKYFHGCGHDGHSAILAGLAAALDSVNTGNNIFFLFQPSEENGKGARLCESIIEDEHINRIYGLHNLPGYTEGRLVIKPDVFCYASMGMRISLQGKQSHAAQPNTGDNPAFTIARIVSSLDLLCNRVAEAHGETTQPNTANTAAIASVISVSAGTRGAFGVCAGSGEIELTVRAKSEDILKSLCEAILQSVGDMQYEAEYFDGFTDTTNDADEVRMAVGIFEDNGIAYYETAKPFLWSEDFGQYLKKTRGMFFGIGIGSDAPPLHTPDYRFNDDVIPNAINAFIALAKQ